ncbi:MAG: nitroreductase family protein [Burkholderiaceae bacterium]|nr:nitroreductase family protein [Microbacteriaceae bacterium]
MSIITDSLSRRADTTSELISPLAERWSPRGFDKDAVISDEVLTTLLEAARWAPSASNMQPARFIVGRRGTPTFDTIHAALMGFNAAWADAASALIVNIAELTQPDGAENPWSRYDLGQAVAHLSIQAQHEGLHTHQMGGIEKEQLAEAFALPARQAIVSVTALGELAEVATLPAELLERESAPRTRKSLDEIVLITD